MFKPRLTRQQRTSVLALLLSCALHLLLLLLASSSKPEREPPAASPAVPSIQARLLPPVVKAAPAQVVTPPPSAQAAAPSTRPQARRTTPPTTARSQPRAAQPSPRAITAPSGEPTWTEAEKAEMEKFLDELARTPQPTLAQRALAMAREQGRQMARQDASEEALLEARPNAPPIHPFSLESYLNGLLRRLNQSAAFVQRGKGDPGVQPAAVRFRLNPDGSLQGFVVLNAGDQAAEIAFIKAVVERSVPFSPFPPDIDRAARSLGITICIRPGSGDGGLGFTRMSGNRC
ncbi:hypothetical protein [Pseudothauera rhizosphaerae]|uniref:Uncharacterized protein n=1 Tax=Pseudothauera rhizosphaerae TaxID=2565932 RepID=A0A4S4AMQ5_9RHOO|nr:hypothetical protein [Pseudothauera rhizosphaerae]THF60451.1 hypothetical protein E6O51_13295 [Pseudothauera rhizosphaerae]